MALLYRAHERVQEAADIYESLVESKRKYYGEGCEQQLHPMKSLGQVLHQGKRSFEALQVFDKFTLVSKHILASGKHRGDKKGLLANMGEVYYEQYLINKTGGENEKAFAALTDHEEVIAQVHGEKSSQNARSLFMKAKFVLDTDKDRMSEGMEYIEKAIMIEGALCPQMPSALIGRLQYTKGVFHYAQEEYEQAMAAFEVAQKSLAHHPDMA